MYLVSCLRGRLQRTSAKISDFQTTPPPLVWVCPNFQNHPLPERPRPNFSIFIKSGGGGGKYINVYPLHEKAKIYINIHKLSFYSALSVNHIMHLNDVFEELLHCIKGAW